MIRSKKSDSRAEINDAKFQNLESVTLTKKSAQNRLIAVLDTNVLLSNNKSIQKLIEKEEVFSHLIFVIPWVVIQELDQCKGKDNTTNINIKAQTSIKLLHKVLKLGLNESVDKKFIFENNLEVR